MADAFFEVPLAINEPVLSYAPGSLERAEVKTMIKKMGNKVIDIPMYIGGRKVRTKQKVDIHPPHDIKKKIGTYSKGNKSHVETAIKAALKAKPAWEAMPWQDRAAIFLKAADLL
ncbi:MAG: aldehyde dehydrogenase family protein, partial [Saprospiraceae bacterium]|nr:aldehyde dehydrogenase family protein [Saprospiraceae bacterium]